MKKSISINISGLLFNIEEDAYERLKRYLDEVKLYFASYDAAGEIVADIENRIAEIFSTKISPSKQVLTLTDVEALITQMGNIQDFAAIEDSYEEARSTNGHSYQTYSQTTGTGNTAGRKLTRDENRKVIGGVAAGIAHYLRIDPLWIRLCLVTFVACDIFLTLAISSSLLVIGYIILWIALPSSNIAHVEDKKIKKLYRNPDDKVIGGVAGGLGAFFGVDAVLIRILFAVGLFTGFGFLAYIILWISMPEARTLTQRMQMQGEPVTLANIENQVKKNSDVKEGEEESLPVRILLFPFKLLSVILSGGSAGARHLFQFLGNIARVIVGVALSFGGSMVLLALIIAAVVFVGVYPDAYLQLFDVEVPFQIIRHTITDFMMSAILLLLAIPTIFIIVLGVALLAHRWMMHRSIGWGLAGIWIIALICLAVTVPRVIINHSQDNYHQAEASFNVDSTQTLLLKLKKGNWNHFRNVAFEVKGTPDGVVRLEQRIWGRGATSQEALEHAQLASYPVKQQGNTLFFNDQLQLPEDEPFYGQSADVTLYIPHGQPFKMDNSMDHVITATLSPWGYRNSDMTNNTFAFNKQGELECISCSQAQREEMLNRKQTQFSGDGRTLGYKDFDHVKVGSHYQVTVIQGSDYKVEVTGDDEALREMKIEQRGSTLSFSSENWNSKWWKGKNRKGQAHIYLTIPNLSALSLSGASKGNVKLQQDKPLKVELSGAAELEGALEVDKLEMELSGSSHANFEGSSQSIVADLSGASELVARQLRSSKAKVDLSGASEASIWVIERLEADISGGSELMYKGNPAYSNIDKGAGADARKLDE